MGRLDELTHSVGDAADDPGARDLLHELGEREHSEELGAEVKPGDLAPEDLQRLREAGSR
jgi:hypothetical protein